ncbi:MAG: hypothetical protein ACE5JX_07150 [Acidobacteriota bacterium]
MTVQSDDDRLLRQILRLNGTILGLVLGAVCALVLFAATNWLVLKGGAHVGPHLQLLSQFFAGYSVSFTGSLIGAGYAFVAGFAVGWVIAWLYNRLVLLMGR